MSSSTDDLIWTDDRLKEITSEDGTEVNFWNGLGSDDRQKLKDHHVMDVLTNHVNANLVTVISLSFCRGITNDTLIQISNMCPQLERLFVVGCDITDDGIVPIAEKYGQQLKTLSYSDCKKCTDAALKSIVNNCNQLGYLGAANCGISTIPENIGYKLTNLKTLNLAYNKITKIPPSLALLKHKEHYIFAFSITNNPVKTNSWPWKWITLISLIFLVLGGIIATLLYFTVLRPKTCGELIPEGINNPLIGNGFCNGGLFMTDACQNDGGDCGDDSCRKPPEGLYSTTSIAIADVNGDGWQDILVGRNSFDDEPHQVLIGNGDGTFQDTIVNLYFPGISNKELQSSSSGGIAVADVNDDGFPDIVDFGSSYVYLWTNKGNGTFQDPVRLSDNYTRGLNAVAIADVNGDGMPDLVLGIYSESEKLAFGINPRSDKLLLNNGDGTFQYPVDLPRTGGTLTINIALADVNGDEAPDILIANADGQKSKSSQLLLNNGDGTFQDPVRLPGDDIVTFIGDDMGGIAVDSISMCAGIAVGDLNGDDKPDILMGGATNLVLWRNKGDGTFEDSVELANLSSYCSIALADMNDDGILDIVVGFPAEVLIGNGDGTFKDPVGLPCRVAMDPSSIAVVDVDNDGKPDIVIGNSGRQSNQLLINLGDGISFKLPSEATSPWLPE
jgi:Leucine-rich repeat (LRR) protein